MRHERILIDCDEASPRFVGAYLRVAGAECAFIETATSHSTRRLLSALEAQGLAPESVRYIIVTHAHLDHAAGAAAMMAACPRAVLLAHPRAARHLIDPQKLIAGATAVYGPERFAAMYGEISPIAKERVQALDDGASVELGDARLTVHHTAGHANHHFVVDDAAADTVYTGDSFGLVYPALQRHGRFALPSTSPSNFDGAEAIKSVARIEALGRGSVSLTHFGAYSDVPVIAGQLRAWLERASRWCDEATASEEPMPALVTKLTAQWRSAIEAEAESRGLHFGSDEWQVLALDLELNAQGLAVAALQRREKPAR